MHEGTRITYVETFDDGSFEIVDAGSAEANQRIGRLRVARYDAESISRRDLAGEAQRLIDEIVKGEWNGNLHIVDMMLDRLNWNLGRVRRAKDKNADHEKTLDNFEKDFRDMAAAKVEAWRKRGRKGRRPTVRTVLDGLPKSSASRKSAGHERVNRTFSVEQILEMGLADPRRLSERTDRTNRPED